MLLSFVESALEGMAEYYVADFAEKVTRGMTDNALKCKYNGSAGSYGYMIDKDKRYQINPTTTLIAQVTWSRTAHISVSTITAM